MMRLSITSLSLLALCAALPAQKPKEETTSASKAKTAQEKAEDQTKEEAKKKPPVWLAITGGTVWPVSRRPIRDGTVLVKDGKIHAVQESRRLHVPEGATVVDARGRHVCPGFVASVANGALGVQGNNAKEKAKDRFDPFSDTMLLCLSTGITTAHEPPGGRGGRMRRMFRGGGGGLGGTSTGVVGGVVGKLTYGTVEGFELRDPAGVYMTYSDAAARLQETREALQKAADHRKKRRAWIDDLVAGKKDAKEPKADPVTEALARCMERELPLVMEADDRREIEGCLELCDAFGVPMVIYGAQEAWTVASEIGRRPVQLILVPRGSGGRGVRPYTNPQVSQPHGWTIRNPALCAGAGIPWATATMSTGVITGLFPGRDLLGLPQEACFAVRGGASEELALRSITLSPAEALMVADRVGSLDPGKDADVLVMDREPLDYRSFVDLAFVNGRLAYDRFEAGLWDHIPTDRSQPPHGWKPYGPWPTLPDLQQPSSDNGNGGND